MIRFGRWIKSSLGREAEASLLLRLRNEKQDAG
jgi:hypothetical protein